VKRLRYYTCCVNWPREDVPALCDMIERGRHISRRTFLKHVDRNDRIELERAFGYAPHCSDSALTIARDWAVSYERSTLHGQTVYFLNHSGIEYVFAEQKT